MADRTGIEWTDATWTPIRARNKATGKIGWHCEHESEGCRFCYAETFNRDRMGTRLPYKPGHRDDVEIFLDETMLLRPLRWKRPRMIFVCSMTDLFAAFMPDAMIDHVFAAMAAAMSVPVPHTFQILTKRTARMRAYLNDPSLPLRIARAFVGRHTDKGWSTRAWKADGVDSVPLRWPLPNVWLGSSCEDQATADVRVPDLLATPAAVRFVSAEPLLGPIDFGATLRTGVCNKCGRVCGIDRKGRHVGCAYSAVRTTGLDWMITGGESGRNARPMHPDWARSIRDQCAVAGLPFFFKQWGEWLPSGQQFVGFANRGLAVGTGDGRIIRRGEGPLTSLDKGAEACGPDAFCIWNVGKKSAGRLLDGVEHNSMPEVRHG